jgi:aminobenzoyl-glutamate utilization protein B
MFNKTLLATVCASMLALPIVAMAQSEMSADQRTELKKELVAAIDKKAKLAQVMNDKIFSFGELGFQEIETSAYLTDLLAKNGFKVEKGISGIPTAWMATWGEGGPVIALGSDLDCIPQASQKPGVAYRDPMIPGAPGPRRRPQLRPGREHHRRVDGEGVHDQEQDQGHDQNLARRRRRIAGDQGVLRA